MESIYPSIELSRVEDMPRFQDIVGRSKALRDVFRQIDTVATTSCTVLVLGETGTGKELVAKAIHERSMRRGGSFVKLNCSAVSTTLIESELFGHEKGAFTGAFARRTGRFEAAHEGTLFLDEIGELPLDVQPKLLRVLQEREFERVGSCQTVRADVRLVAATHRNLEDMCATGKFREDLFYRLNVFPIHLPALRERREDIPLLVRHFVPLLAQRMNKELRSISSASMESLCDYDWPGNIRELQNVLERAVILSEGPVLEVRVGAPPSSSRVSPIRSTTHKHAGTLEEMNRAHILAVLASTNGVVAGPNGAAARLGMKRSTLNFRMRKLGIERSAAATYGMDETRLLRAAND